MPGQGCAGQCLAVLRGESSARNFLQPFGSSLITGRMWWVRWLQLMSKSITSSFFVSIRCGRRWQEAPSSTFSPAVPRGAHGSSHGSAGSARGLPAVADSKQPNAQVAAPYTLLQCGPAGGHAAEDTSQVCGTPSAHSSPREASGRHSSGTLSRSSLEPFGVELRASSRGRSSGAPRVRFPSKELQKLRATRDRACRGAALRLWGSCPL